MKKNNFDRDLLQKVGLRIRTMRLMKGWSQELLAFESGLDRTYIGSVERGKRNIAVINLKRIAGALGVSLSELLRDI